MKRQCLSNSQYSRREYLEVTGIPDSTELKDLEQTVLKLFEKLDLMVDSANVADCHWIKTINSSKKVLIKLSKRKNAAKIRSSNKELKGMDLLSLGTRDEVCINNSSCKYYKLLRKKCKS